MKGFKAAAWFLQHVSQSIANIRDFVSILLSEVDFQGAVCIATAPLSPTLCVHHHLVLLINDCSYTPQQDSLALVGKAASMEA